MSQPNDSSSEQPKIIIDEGWKEQVQAEKEALQQAQDAPEGEAQEQQPSPQPAASQDEPPLQLPPADFPGLLTLLATQASMSLSPGQDEQGNPTPPVLEIAKHYIDLIAVLEEKTQGNLAADEAQMLSAVLHQLRMTFVAVQSGGPVPTE